MHFRGAKEMRTAPNHPIQPTRLQMVKRIDQELMSGLFTEIFLATDTNEDLEFFKNRYGKLIFSFEASRFKKNLRERNRDSHGYLCGLEYLSDLYMLSNCKQLIAGYSGVSNMALVVRDPLISSLVPNLIWNGRNSANKYFAKHQYNIKRLYINFKLKTSF